MKLLLCSTLLSEVQEVVPCVWVLHVHRMRVAGNLLTGQCVDAEGEGGGFRKLGGAWEEHLAAACGLHLSLMQVFSCSTLQHYQCCKEIGKSHSGRRVSVRLNWILIFKDLRESLQRIPRRLLKTQHKHFLQLSVGCLYRIPWSCGERGLNIPNTHTDTFRIQFLNFPVWANFYKDLSM